MGRVLRQQKRVDYRHAIRKYDGLSFRPAQIQLRPPQRRLGFAGRARAAPPSTTWPHPALHASVDYFANIATDAGWAAAVLADDVRLPFAWLDPAAAVKWQGLVQSVPMNGDAAARQHFDAVSAQLRGGMSNPAITEAVGEAAAAMAMLALGGWRMIWGFHLHAGTGIDQIWLRTRGNGRPHYHIVEAKGPGAGLTDGRFLPPTYAQMERGWVVNHLRSMHANGHAAGVAIVNDLGLVFNVAHANYRGATRSYYGLAPTSRHAASGCRLTGQVITAQWLADSRLDGNGGPLLTYV